MEIARVPQTTHDTDVNNAISINVQKLREDYGEPNVGDGFIKEIENFINELECIANDAQKASDKDQLTADEQKHALECLKRIKNDPDSHSGSGLRLKQVLSLVWKACKDKNKKSTDNNIDINTRISQRKYQLVKHLVESQTAVVLKVNRKIDVAVNKYLKFVWAYLFTAMLLLYRSSFRAILLSKQSTVSY